MDTKLTLTIDKHVINKAKRYAKNSGRSLSDLVENYLKNLTSSDKSEFDLSPRVKTLMGSFRLPKDFDYKSEMTHLLMNKYAK